MARLILHEFSADYIPDFGEIDLDRLRRAVAVLMEKGAQAIQVDGYEQDDAELDRLMVVRFRGENRTITIPIESLTDLDRLLAPFHAAAPPQVRHSDSSRHVEIVGLVVQVIADPDDPLGGTIGRQSR